MFTEPTITWVPSGFSGYIWLDTKIVLKKKSKCNVNVYRYYLIKQRQKSHAIELSF